MSFEGKGNHKNRTQVPNTTSFAWGGLGLGEMSNEGILEPPGGSIRELISWGINKKRKKADRHLIQQVCIGHLRCFHLLENGRVLTGIESNVAYFNVAYSLAQ